MTAATTKRQIDKMVAMECRGWGDQTPALSRICHRYRLREGTLDNIRTGRTKRILADVRDAVRLAYIDMCQREVAKWREEIATEKAKGNVDDDLNDMARQAEDLAARLEKRRQSLGGGR